MTERVAPQILSNRLQLEFLEFAVDLIGMVFGFRSAIGKSVILVRFLGIRIRTDLYDVVVVDVVVGVVSEVTIITMRRERDVSEIRT